MKGLDAGTGNFVSYDGNKISIQRNVFLTLSENVTTKQLNAMNIPYAVLNGKIHIIGTKAYELANIFNSSDLKRPMANGLLNPTEPNALPILQLIIKNLLGEPNEKNEKVIYCVPGKPIDSNQEIDYHQDVLKLLIDDLGYKSESVNEAQALGLIGLENNNYTGIAISFGAGMCNICIMYSSIPVLTFSITKAGDFITENVARDCGISKAKANYIKEKGDYSISSNYDKTRTKEQNAIKTYYEVLIRYILSNIEAQFEKNSVPVFPEPVPIVCGGGTAMVNGFIDVFKEQFLNKKFDLNISDIILINEPLTAVAKGCYKYGEM